VILESCFGIGLLKMVFEDRFGALLQLHLLLLVLGLILLHFKGHLPSLLLGFLLGDARLNQILLDLLLELLRRLLAELLSGLLACLLMDLLVCLMIRLLVLMSVLPVLGLILLSSLLLLLVVVLLRPVLGVLCPPLGLLSLLSLGEGGSAECQ